MVLLEIPRVEHDNNNFVAEMDKLRLSNRTLTHRVSALELQLKQLKLMPNLNMNLNFTENSKESSPWTNEIERQLRSELEEAKSQLEAVTVDLKKMSEAHNLLEKSFTNLQHSHSQLEGTLTKMSQSLSALEESQVNLQKTNVDLQRDLSLVQDKQTGVFLSLGCQGGGRDGNYIKWNYESFSYIFSDDPFVEILAFEGAGNPNDKSFWLRGPYRGSEGSFRHARVHPLCDFSQI